MALDPRGVPLRVRSLLAGLPPERKDALRAVAARVRPGGDDGDPVEAALDAWFARHGADVRGRVLEVGPRGLARRSAPTAEVAVLDPWGRGGAAFVGPVGPVLGDARFDVVVAPLRVDDPVTVPAVGPALDALAGVLAPGGVLLVAVVAADAATMAEAAVAVDALVAAERAGEALEHGRAWRVVAP